jgi:hypothetical protein
MPKKSIMENFQVGLADRALAFMTMSALARPVLGAKVSVTGARFLTAVCPATWWHLRSCNWFLQPRPDRQIRTGVNGHSSDQQALGSSKSARLFLHVCGETKSKIV